MTNHHHHHHSLLRLILTIAVICSLGTVVSAWMPPTTSHLTTSTTTPPTALYSSIKEKQQPSVEETTEKYGLEAGLFQSLRQKSDDKGEGVETAKSLLKRYGIAYLATSIPLAAVSFAICYVLVDNGVDVAGLLSKLPFVGDNVGANTETAGTVAIAYAAHKAASPIRFPPTVILTPVVAKLIGKEPNTDQADDDDQE